MYTKQSSLLSLEFSFKTSFYYSYSHQ